MASPSAKLNWKSNVSIGKLDGSQTDGSGFLEARPRREFEEPVPDPPEHARRSLQCVYYHVQPEYQARPYWWLPLSKGEPRLVHVHTSPSHWRRAGKERSVAFATYEVARSIKRIRSFPATPAISRRWSSTGLDDDGSPRSSGGASRLRRSTISGTDSAADALSAVRAKLTRRAASIRQMETPTVVTLRRASAVLDTVAQRRVCDMSDDPRTAPTRRASGLESDAQPPAQVAAYLITREEMNGLADLVQRTFADGTLREMSGESADAAGGKGKARAGSVPARIMSCAGAGPLKSVPADVAVTVADVHTMARSAPASSARKASSRSQGSRKSSIVSAVLPARKSIHEIVWGDDGAPQSLRSSTWRRAGFVDAGGDGPPVATCWSSDSFRREVTTTAGNGGEGALSAEGPGGGGKGRENLWRCRSWSLRRSGLLLRPTRKGP